MGSLCLAYLEKIFSRIYLFSLQIAKIEKNHNDFPTRKIFNQTFDQNKSFSFSVTYMRV